VPVGLVFLEAFTSGLFPELRVHFASETYGTVNSSVREKVVCKASVSSLFYIQPIHVRIAIGQNPDSVSVHIQSAYFIKLTVQTSEVFRICHAFALNTLQVSELDDTRAACGRFSAPFLPNDDVILEFLFIDAHDSLELAIFIDISAYELVGQVKIPFREKFAGSYQVL